MFTLTNSGLANGDVVIGGGVVVPQGGTTTVSVVTKQVAEAIAAGLVTLSGTATGPITDNSTGTAATDGAIAAVTDVASAADAIATLTSIVNSLLNTNPIERG